ncbi:Glycosyltransferase SunS, partial [Frankliniella fusca]
MIHVNVHHFKNSAHQIEVKLTKPFSAGKKVLFTHSVRLVNVSITLYNDLKSRGGSLSSLAEAAMVERRPATQRTRVHLKQTLFTQRANLENMKRITNPPTLRFEIIILGWQKCAAVDCSFGKNGVGF